MGYVGWGRTVCATRQPTRLRRGRDVRNYIKALHLCNIAHRRATRRKLFQNTDLEQRDDAQGLMHPHDM